MSFDEEAVAKICLAHFREIGSQRLRLLKRVFGSYKRAWSADRQSLLDAGLSESLVQRFIAWRKRCEPADLINTLMQEHIRVVFPEDVDFPHLLRVSSDPPELLFVRGDLPCLAPAPLERLVVVERGRPLPPDVPAVAEEALVNERECT
jgi:predicted Rossmann fold nucleotide-binding protein DprA/Smf involved in DNA uptake